MKKMFKSDTIKNFVTILNKPDVRVLPGTIAFFLFMSIVPLMMLGALIFSKLSFSLVNIIDIFSEMIPSNVYKLLTPILTNVGSNKLSGWYVIVGLILASNGTHSLILASNTLYGIENKSYIYRRIKALIMIIVASTVFFFILFVLGFGNTILKFVLSLEMFAEVGPKIYSMFLILKWPIAIVVIFILIKVIYTIAPDKKIPSKYVNKGVMFTTIGWVISTSIYSFYATNIANYDLIYGSLSSIMVLLIWVYVMSYILVVGIAINTNIYELETKK